MRLLQDIRVTRIWILNASIATKEDDKQLFGLFIRFISLFYFYFVCSSLKQQQQKIVNLETEEEFLFIYFREEKRGKER